MFLHPFLTFFTPYSVPMGSFLFWKVTKDSVLFIDQLPFLQYNWIFYNKKGGFLETDESTNSSNNTECLNSFTNKATQLTLHLPQDHLKRLQQSLIPLLNSKLQKIHNTFPAQQQTISDNIMHTSHLPPIRSIHQRDKPYRTRFLAPENQSITRHRMLPILMSYSTITISATFLSPSSHIKTRDTKPVIKSNKGRGR